MEAHTSGVHICLNSPVSPPEQAWKTFSARLGSSCSRAMALVDESDRLRLRPALSMWRISVSEARSCACSPLAATRLLSALLSTSSRTQLTAERRAA